MTNKEIIKSFKLLSALSELHGENPFKIRSYQNAIFQIEKLETALDNKSPAELEDLGFKSGMAAKLRELIEKGTLPELEQLLLKTPAGVTDLLSVKGLGAKKVYALWQELQIESLPALLEACQQNRVAGLKGFGEKTQQAIMQAISFKEENARKLRYADAEALAQVLEKTIADSGLVEKVMVSGQIRRRMEVVEVLQMVAVPKEAEALRSFLNQWSGLEYNEKISGPRVWRGAVAENQLPVEIKFATPDRFFNALLLNSAHESHLVYPLKEAKNGTLASLATAQAYESEEAIYKAAGLPWMAPELREGTFEFDLAKSGQLPVLVEMTDLKGSLHNHSTYSDGNHTLEEMAVACRELGYEYLGISDHSKSAFYANGLSEERIVRQHQEIDRLNETMAPFRIFKGIEADILNDGSLDYDDEVLASFDFVVASIHSNLKMDEEKATQRLLRAIANPYTTILGHPTGRLLLNREGYPMNHKAVIDACAEHGVVIEINANPWRLDLDWRWVRYAIEQGVMLSINPDAHDRSSYSDMYYGLLAGRKGGMQKKDTLNALSAEEIATFFEQKKSTTQSRMTDKN